MQLFSLKYIEDYWKLGNWKLGQDKTKLPRFVCSCIHTADTDKTRQSCLVRVGGVNWALKEVCCFVCYKVISFVSSIHSHKHLDANLEWKRWFCLQNEGDRDSLREVRYYPNKGFAFKYYPYYNQPHYLQPIVFVQFDTPQAGTLIQVDTRSSATAEIARDAEPWTSIQCHSRSSVVVPNNAALYDFLLALSSNLTSIINRS